MCLFYLSSAMGSFVRSVLRQLLIVLTDSSVSLLAEATAHLLAHLCKNTPILPQSALSAAWCPPVVNAGRAFCYRNRNGDWNGEEW